LRCPVAIKLRERQTRTPARTQSAKRDRTPPGGGTRGPGRAPCTRSPSPSTTLAATAIDLSGRDGLPSDASGARFRAILPGVTLAFRVQQYTWQPPNERAVTSGPNTTALVRWETEGGALGLIQRGSGTLSEQETHILQYFGAAVLLRWDELPTHIQRELCPTCPRRRRT
jgi:hypothetical protein